MNYELLKDLGNAGLKCKDYICPDGHFEDLPNPTLSELIGACGTGFSSLSFSSTGWTVYGVGDNQIVVEGASPEEAVARLWLALNKK